MKTIIRNKVLVAVASSLVFLTCAQAQTIIVDNTAATVSSSDVIDSGNWQANSFTMDGTSRSLQSVTLSLDNGNAVGGNFQVQLWSSGGSQPVTLLATLSGNSNPLTANSYSYTPSSTVTLSADTKYWVVAEGSTTSGTYNWNFATSSASTGVGTLGGWSNTANAGTSWNAEINIEPFMFNVTAGAVPEPSSYTAVFGVLALGFGVASRHRRRG
jgi:hypothetical protein